MMLALPAPPPLTTSRTLVVRLEQAMDVRRPKVDCRLDLSSSEHVLWNAAGLLRAALPALGRAETWETVEALVAWGELAAARPTRL
eukprot:CAMPEP_0171750894 /NCGR_PEP_ID=MMETSP0991-20121206/41682_1 /TAXON_ID=483369 /ORGANISM="non described non described, Strain CCMP2098" /LENGTH=85 /DNA_ID=CAMNT_0012351953 /DNA_START=377 /DNA_END=630 /DNA_ORIENTATION=-